MPSSLKVHYRNCRDDPEILLTPFFWRKILFIIIAKAKLRADVRVVRLRCGGSAGDSRSSSTKSASNGSSCNRARDVDVFRVHTNDLTRLDWTPVGPFP